MDVTNNGIEELEGVVVEWGAEVEAEYITVQQFSIGTAGDPSSDAAEYSISSGEYVLSTLLKTYRHITLEAESPVFESSDGLYRNID